MNTTLQIRIDKKMKQSAAETFAKLGLDLSSGVKLFITQVVNDQALPFQPSLNNAKIEQYIDCYDDLRAQIDQSNYSPADYEEWDDVKKNV